MRLMARDRISKYCCVSSGQHIRPLKIQFRIVQTRVSAPTIFRHALTYVRGELLLIFLGLALGQQLPDGSCAGVRFGFHVPFAFLFAVVCADLGADLVGENAMGGAEARLAWAVVGREDEATGLAPGLEDGLDQRRRRCAAVGIVRKVARESGDFKVGVCTG